jgi:arylformamidase
LKSSTSVLKHTVAGQNALWPEQPSHSSAEYFDNQYNNRLRVPNFLVDHLEPWAQRSQVVRKQFAPELNISYGNAVLNETLDIFGAGGMDKPVVVFIHGGYWRALDKSDFSFVSEPFVEAGACVVVTNYALCPKASMSQIVMQQVAALVWVYRNIATYGGDVNRIRVIGHSAGGHLAAMLLACRWTEVRADLPVHLVERAMSLSGLFDLHPITNAPTLQADLQITEQEALRCSPALIPIHTLSTLDIKQPTLKQSKIKQLPVKSPKVKLFAFCGADESPEFLRQNALIEKSWGEEIVTKREALLGLNHFSIVDALCTPGHYLNRSALEFLR